MSWLSDLVGKIPVVGGAINSAAHNFIDPALRAGVSALPGGSAILGAGDAIGSHIPNPGGAISGGLGSLAGLAGAGGGSGSSISPAILALAGLQGANATQLGNKANDFADKGWNAVNDSYQSRAPLRSAGIASLTNPHAPNLGNLGAIAGRIKAPGGAPMGG